MGASDATNGGTMDPMSGSIATWEMREAADGVVEAARRFAEGGPTRVPFNDALAMATVMAFVFAFACVLVVMWHESRRRRHGTPFVGPGHSPATAATRAMYHPEAGAYAPAGRRRGNHPNRRH